MKKIKGLFFEFPELKEVKIEKDSEGDITITCVTSRGLTAIGTTFKEVRIFLKEDR